MQFPQFSSLLSLLMPGLPLSDPNQMKGMGGKPMAMLGEGEFAQQLASQIQGENQAITSSLNETLSETNAINTDFFTETLSESAAAIEAAIASEREGTNTEISLSLAALMTGLIQPQAPASIPPIEVNPTIEQFSATSDQTPHLFKRPEETIPTSLLDSPLPIEDVSMAEDLALGTHIRGNISQELNLPSMVRDDSPAKPPLAFAETTVEMMPPDIASLSKEQLTLKRGQAEFPLATEENSLVPSSIKPEKVAVDVSAKNSNDPSLALNTSQVTKPALTGLGEKVTKINSPINNNEGSEAGEGDIADTHSGKSKENFSSDKPSANMTSFFASLKEPVLKISGDELLGTMVREEVVFEGLSLEGENRTSGITMTQEILQPSSSETGTMPRFSSPSHNSAAYYTDVPLDHVQFKIMKAIEEGTRTIELQLHPEALGKIGVNIEIHADGTTHLQILAEKADTLELLKRDASNLEQALQEAGLKAEAGGLQFGLQEGNSGQQQQQQPKFLYPNSLSGTDIALSYPIEEQQLIQEYFGEIKMNDRLDVRV